MSDQAFRRAIASDPADDTARLVYADYLEETGEPVHVARADFIRTQVEASTLHPNHPRRGELDARAAGLFSAHWVDWWAPVCAAVGLPPPFVPTGLLRERIGQFFGLKLPRLGHPYKAESGVVVAPIPRLPPAPPNTIRQVAFARGFPQWVSLLGQLSDVRHVVHAWTTAVPLAALSLNGIVARDWQQVEGEHLHGVRELALANAATTAMVAAGASRHLPRVEEVALRPDRVNAHWPEEQYRAFAASPLAGRVKRLRVTLFTAEEAQALDGPHLAGLRGLYIEGVPTFGVTGSSDHARPAVSLLAARHLTGLRELTLAGWAAEAVGRVPDALAARLDRLAVHSESGDSLARVLHGDQFPAVTDLTVSPLRSVGVLASLAESPLAPRLRHLRIACGFPTDEVRSALRRLCAALDPDRLETLALDRPTAAGAWHELRERFPGRVSVV